MPETELARALHDLTPEPPSLLSEDLLLRQAKQRRTRRALLPLVPLTVVALAALAVAVTDRPTSQVLGEAPEPSPSATALPVPAPSQPPTSANALTRGTGDVDGDGREDAVTVSSATGGVTVELASGTSLRAVVPYPDASTRLQAVATLWGRGAVLVYSSAAGCCRDAPADSQSYVLVVHEGGLVLVHDSDGQPYRLLFSSGRGDLYAGIRCQSSEVLVTAVRQESPTRARASRTLTALDGSRVVVVSTTSQQVTPPAQTQASEVLGCAGLTTQGRAAP